MSGEPDRWNCHVPRELLRLLAGCDLLIGARGRVVFGLIAELYERYKDTGGTGRASLNRLTQTTGLHRRSVERAIADLCAEGVLVAVEARTGRSKLYRFDLEALRARAPERGPQSCRRSALAPTPMTQMRTVDDTDAEGGVGADADGRVGADADPREIRDKELPLESTRARAREDGGSKDPTDGTPSRRPVANGPTHIGGVVGKTAANGACGHGREPSAPSAQKWRELWDEWNKLQKQNGLKISDLLEYARGDQFYMFGERYEHLWPVARRLVHKEAK